MKISIITVAYNAAKTIGEAIESVWTQDYHDVEYIVIDGNSSDGTVEVIRSNKDKITQWLSEPDKGIYDAMNKGIAMATGEVVGMLNADDFYASLRVLSKVMREFKDPRVDAVFGDIVFQSKDNLEKTVRTYSSKRWHPGKFAWGYMPAHPSFFVRRKYYDDLGMFKTDYQIAADYELLIRFLYVHQLKYRYIPEKLVKMRTGGASTRNLRSNIILNREIIRGCRENGVRTNVAMVYSKYFRKIFELIPGRMR